MVRCAQCGLELGPEFADEPKLPCPDCGSSARAYELKAEPGRFRLSGASVTISLVTYPQRLVATARRLFDEQDFGVALVVACMAAEIAAGRRMTRAFADRGIPDLEQTITGLYSGSALSNDRIRALYLALTGDDLAQQSFWPGYKASAKLRNELVHSSTQASRDEAEQGIASSEELIKHLGEWGR